MGVNVLTFGCRLNINESEAMRQMAGEAGLTDATLVNTCAVTAEAVAQARQAIRKARRDRPGAPVIVTGCAAQTDPDQFTAMPEVAQVLGNDAKMRAETWARLARSNGLGLAEAGKGEVGDIFAATQAPSPVLDRFEGRTRAFVQVQNGCDHRCTFCVIPYGRGRSRSVPVAEAVERVRRLVEGGLAEVVLTGVDLTSYGRDLDAAPSLGDLVGAILEAVPELPRLRLSSLDAVEVDGRLERLIADEPRLMPHLHLSLQSGDDLILKRMKRRHSRADAIGFCARMRRLRPDIVFGADLIAGFPTEDEAMFRRTLDLVAECGLAFVHVFPFSARPGTPAARMPQLDGGLVRERARRLREVAAGARTTHLASLVGTTAEVLAERGGTGRTPCFTPVRLGGGVEPGRIIPVRIAGHDGERLLAA